MTYFIGALFFVIGFLGGYLIMILRKQNWQAAAMKRVTAYDAWLSSLSFEQFVALQKVLHPRQYLAILEIADCFKNENPDVQRDC